MRKPPRAALSILLASTLYWAHATPAVAASCAPPMPCLLAVTPAPAPHSAGLSPQSLRIAGYMLSSIGSQLAISGLALGIIGIRHDSRDVTIGGWSTLGIGMLMIVPAFALLVEGNPWRKQNLKVSF